MATTPPFNFSLPDYFVDAQSLCTGCTSAKFEAQQNGETVQIQTVLVPADAQGGSYFLCIRYMDEPFLRAEPHLYVPWRGKAPTRYDSDKPESLEGHMPRYEGQNKIDVLLQYSKERFIFLVDTERLGGTGFFWLYLNDRLRSGTWISFSDPSKSLSFSIEPCFEDFVVALAHPDSDIRFVLRWIELPLEARISLNTFYTNGDEKELRQVVQAISLYEALQHGHEKLLYDSGFLETDWMRKYLKIGPPPPKFRVPYPAPTLRLEMWGKHVRNYFQIDGDVELTRKHQWLRPIQPNFTIECAQATQHERMEAALFLREWARGKIPPDELRVLLPTLEG